MQEFHALEDAVWASAAVDAKTAEHLRAALGEFRAKRSRQKPGNVLVRMLQSPAAVISSFVAIGGMTFQQCSAASERRLQRAKAHLEVRAAFIDSYVDAPGDDLVKRAQILRAADGLGSTMLECRHDEQGPRWLTIVDLGDAAAERADCEDRKRFAQWVKREIESMEADLERSQTARSAAALEVATQQAEAGDEQAVQDPTQTQALLVEEQKRIVARQTLSDVQPKAAASLPESQDALSRARAAWQDGYRAYQRNERDRARQHYERALKAKPDYFAALNSLGRMELEDNGNVATAIRYYRDALKAKPDYAPALYNLAIAYAKTKSPEACTALEEAHGRVPNYTNRPRVDAFVRAAVTCPSPSAAPLRR